nr:MAG TPA: hypothetical protein [Caudoviricetes sp.]
MYLHFLLLCGIIKKTEEERIGDHEKLERLFDE